MFFIYSITPEAELSDQKRPRGLLWLDRRTTTSNGELTIEHEIEIEETTLPSGDFSPAGISNNRRRLPFYLLALYVLLIYSTLYQISVSFHDSREQSSISTSNHHHRTDLFPVCRPLPSGRRARRD